MSVSSFAEEICWVGDQRRVSKKEVVFRVTSIGKIQGWRVDFELRASYDLWYDPDDEALIDVLSSQAQWIDWGALIFYKKPDHSAIVIFDPAEDRELGQITVRRRMGGDPSGEIDMTNVVALVPRRPADVAEKSL